MPSLGIIPSSRCRRDATIDLQVSTHETGSVMEGLAAVYA
jgi:hypothetical protein